MSPELVLLLKDCTDNNSNILSIFLEKINIFSIGMILI